MPFKYLLCEIPCVLCKIMVLLFLFVLFVFFFCLACTQRWQRYLKWSGIKRHATDNKMLKSQTTGTRVIRTLRVIWGWYTKFSQLTLVHTETQDRKGQIPSSEIWGHFCATLPGFMQYLYHNIVYFKFFKWIFIV